LSGFDQANGCLTGLVDYRLGVGIATEGLIQGIAIQGIFF